MSNKKGRSRGISNNEVKERSKEVAKLCRNIIRTHAEECQNESANITPIAFALDFKRTCKDQEERLRYFEQQLGTEKCHPTEIDERTDAAASGDAALSSLYNIITNDEQDNLKIPVVIPMVEKMPKYDAWVPVRSNYQVDEDHELEPYMPYTDDKNENRRKARAIQDEMLRASGQFGMELSDGEVDSNDEYIVPEGDQKEWEFFSEYSTLSNARRREASRNAIIIVFEQYGSVPGVMEGLSEGLNIKPMRRLEKFIKISHERHEKLNTNYQTRRRRRETTSEITMSLKNPTDADHVIPPGTLSTEAMKHFCLICQTFACGHHDHPNSFPIQPIRDIRQEIRNKKIAEKKIDPCSNECSFSTDTDHEPESREEPWINDELMILNEALPVFGKDSCSLAVVVGSRTCRGVQRKLAEISKESGKDLSEYTKSMENIGKKDTLTRVMREKTPKRKRRKEVNMKEIENADGQNVLFDPCFHDGDCDEKCTCVQAGYRCEATCGCKNVRFIVGEEGKGMARFVDRSRGYHGEHGLCSNTTPGCKCKNGKCNTNNCPCWNVRRACNPDICRDCGIDILPQRGHDRRCANIPASFAPTGRTIIGRSSVHGLGLFAAQSFEPGDLIGVYSGQLPDPRQVGLIDNIYELKDKTFFFSVFKDRVIDAGLLGSKVRFANHAPQNSEQANCEGYLVRSRGEDQIGLFATRSIPMGDEICFDYKIEGNVPAWLSRDDGAKEEKEDGTTKSEVAASHTSKSKNRAGSSQKPVSRKPSGSRRKSKRKRR